MMIIAGAGQFLFLIVIVVVKLVNSVSVTFHFLAHGEVDSSRAKRLRFFVGAGARRSYFFGSLIVELVDMDLLHVVSTQAHVPAFGSGDVRTKRTWLSRITHR